MSVICVVKRHKIVVFDTKLGIARQLYSYGILKISCSDGRSSKFGSKVLLRSRAL